LYLNYMFRYDINGYVSFLYLPICLL